MEPGVIVALSLIVTCALGGAVALAAYLPRRRREKLRRRGIKTYEQGRGRALN